MSAPTTAALHQVFYISRSLATPQEVDRILERARHHNSLRGVTGALLFTGGHFAQLLEGSREALADTMAEIKADARHEAVTLLIDGEASSRRFEAWTMAYLEAPGADDLIEQLLAAGAVPAERAERLLRLMLESAAHQSGQG